MQKLGTLTAYPLPTYQENQNTNSDLAINSATDGGIKGNEDVRQSLQLPYRK